MSNELRKIMNGTKISAISRRRRNVTEKTMVSRCANQPFENCVTRKEYMGQRLMYVLFTSSIRIDADTI